MKLFKCRLVWMVIAYVAWAGVSFEAHAETESEVCASPMTTQFMCSLGDRDPIPFGILNQRAELADGEIYQLSGRVMTIDGAPVLKIDFCAHPWLASASRLAFPYYYLESTPLIGKSWSAYVGQTVTFAFRAKGRVEMRSHGRAFYSIWLQPINSLERSGRNVSGN